MRFLKLHFDFDAIVKCNISYYRIYLAIDIFCIGVFEYFFPQAELRVQPMLFFYICSVLDILGIIRHAFNKISLIHELIPYSNR